MKHLPLILSLILIAGLTWLYFRKEAGYKQREKQLIESHKSAMDSSRAMAEDWRLRAGKTVRHNNWVYAPYPIKTATKAPKQAEYQVL